MSPDVDPAVTAGAVRFTVAGEHTAAGLVTITTGVAFMVIRVVAVTIPQPPAAAIVYVIV
jgi:hypothetical protein